MSGDLAAAFAGASKDSTTNNNSMDSVMDDDDYPEMWTEAPFSSTSPLHKGLQAMEELMRCNICRDLMKIPVSLIPCHHTFCKHCFEKYAKTSLLSIKRKVNCPCCRCEVPDKDLSKYLVPNSTVEELIHNYKDIRSQLKASLEVAAQVSQAGTSSSSSSSTIGTTDQPTTNDTANPRTSGRGRKRGRRNYAEMDDNGDDDDTENYQDNDNENNDCAEVLQPMDDNQTTTTTVGRVAPSSFAQGGLKARKKKHKTNYHALKKKQQLKDLCAKEGLPTTGTPDDLKSRHDAFISLYNAECDSTRPRSVSQLIQAVITEERNQKSYAAKTAKDAKCMETLKKQREQLGKDDQAGTAVVALSSGNPAFDSKVKSNFDSLTAKLLAREKKKPRTSPAPSAASDIDMDNAATSDQTQSPALGSSGDERAACAAVSNAAANQQAPSATAAATPAGFTGVNPYRKTPSSSGPGNASPSSLLLSVTNVATPAAAAPNLFPPGSNAPSTISHKQSQSQSFAVPSPSQGAAVVDTLDKIAQAGAGSSSPANSNVSASTSANERAPAPPAQEADSAPVAAPTTAVATTTSSEAGNASNSSRATRRTAAKNALTATVTRTTRARRTATPVPHPAAARRGGRSICGPWSCTICTFENTTRVWSTANCEMCSNSRSVAEEQPTTATQREATVSL